jgi:hypothetical protein
MDPLDLIQEQEKKIQSLENELIELRQGLAVVQDYFRGLVPVALEQEATAEVDQEFVRPLVDEDLEFEGIWEFHQKMLVADPNGSIPLDTMYDTFAAYCRSRGRKPVDKIAFEFLLPQMEDPRPVIYRGKWQDCRFRTDWP